MARVNREEHLVCYCGECYNSNDQLVLSYECIKCKRTVSFCYGAADKYFEMCDQCAVAAMDLESATMATTEIHNIKLTK